jgi:fidgetin-like protein 1
MATAEKAAAKEARKLEKSKEPLAGNSPTSTSGWMGDGTVPPIQYPELSRPPALPPRPSFFNNRQSSENLETPSQSNSSALPPPPALPVPAKETSRSPSPDQRHKKTMLTTLRSSGRKSSKPKTTRVSSQRPAPLKAAGMAWDTTPILHAPSEKIGLGLQRPGGHDATIPSRLDATATRRSFDQAGVLAGEHEVKKSNAVKASDAGDYIPSSNWRDMQQISSPPALRGRLENLGLDPEREIVSPELTKPPDISYRKEFPSSSLRSMPANNLSAKSPSAYPDRGSAAPLSRKPLADGPNTGRRSSTAAARPIETSSGSCEDSLSRQRPPSGRSKSDNSGGAKTQAKSPKQSPTTTTTPPSSSEATTADDDQEETEASSESAALEGRKAAVLEKLPKNVDLATATQIMNEIIVDGDEVHWSDVAGLEAAKKALKEAVVYPFLRPDLFMGLREPARGMLLFGPPGTGKTMLARAVATESKSTFFAISASSLTSKWHGESEKLVRALFAIARRMAPSIIFVDEIDSLLGSRGGAGGSEHEASRRSKTEFLIQWSDLQKAAAGNNGSKGGNSDGGDPTRVLVLAATNIPWDIDDAARRRFVRRQYIPLPEAETREVQLRTLLGHQNHELSPDDIEVLVQVTDGSFSSLF